MRFHLLVMVWCPVGCAFPIALFHRIAGNDIDTDVVNVEFQKRMLRISIDCLSIDPLSNRGEDLLGPFLPIHCGRKAGKDIQVGLATQPGVPGEGPLDRDHATESSFVKYSLNLALQSLS